MSESVPKRPLYPPTLKVTTEDIIKSNMRKDLKRPSDYENLD